MLTWGCALLPGIREVAQNVLNVPVRVAKPENMTGMAADALKSPAFSTSVGLLRLGLQMDSAVAQPAREGGIQPTKIGNCSRGFSRSCCRTVRIRSASG